MMSKWIIYVIVIYLTKVSGKCDNPAGNTGNHCKLTMLKQLGEYQNIVEEITDISCPLSNMSNFEVQNPVSLINRNYSEIVHSFNATCRRYIDTLAFKYQLQKMMFNRNATLSSDAALQITLLIINLQTVALKLQQIGLKLDKQYCATFSPGQYELIYFSRLHKENTISSLCHKAIIWQNKNNVCTRWPQYT